MSKRPLPTEYPASFAGYVDLVPEADVVGALGAQVEVLRQLAAAISPERETYAYAPGKWTIRQVVGHLGDVERVFSFRALCFARSEQTPLPGFDENAYVEHSRFNDTRLGELIEELVLLRSSNLKMLTSLSEAQWSATGVANGKSISVRALAYVMVGHVRHHVAMLRDRYGVGGGGR
jgi:hypothetical protein